MVPRSSAQKQGMAPGAGIGSPKLEDRGCSTFVTLKQVVGKPRK